MTAAPGVARCLWCAGPIAPRPETRLGRCRECGAGTTWPHPSERELSGNYASWYRPSTGRFAGPGDLLLRLTRRSLARRLVRLAPPGPVLDIGSGDGILVDELRARGREVVAVERAPLRNDYRVVDVTELEEEWAAVVFFHSLEHLPAPAAALEHAVRHLLPGGLLIVAAPNFESLQARVFGDRWFALDLPLHRVHLPARTFLARLRTLGLRVERVSHLRGGQTVFGWLHGLVGLLPGRPDLLDAIRRPAARRRPLGGGRRIEAVAAAVALLPVATVLALLEAAARRGGTMYVEARRA